MFLVSDPTRMDMPNIESLHRKMNTISKVMRTGMPMKKTARKMMKKMRVGRGAAMKGKGHGQYQ